MASPNKTHFDVRFNTVHIWTVQRQMLLFSYRGKIKYGLVQLKQPETLFPLKYGAGPVFKLRNLRPELGVYCRVDDWVAQGCDAGDGDRQNLHVLNRRVLEDDGKWRQRTLSEAINKGLPKKKLHSRGFGTEVETSLELYRINVFQDPPPRPSSDSPGGSGSPG